MLTKRYRCKNCMGFVKEEVVSTLEETVNEGWTYHKDLQQCVFELNLRLAKLEEDFVRKCL